MRRAARVLVDAGLSPVVVVVSADPRLAGALGALPVTTVVNPQPALGISRSIAAGLLALSESAAAALIAVADQPDVSAEAVGALTNAYVAGSIVVASYGDHRGTPAIFDRRFFAELLALDGDHGGLRVIAEHPESVLEVSLAPEVGHDIDRPEDWRG